MNISVSRAIEDLIRCKVESGSYDSVGQVIQEALLLLEERDQVTQMRRDRLLKEIAKGVYQADNRQLVGFDEVLRGLERKPAAASHFDSPEDGIRAAFSYPSPLDDQRP